jgi:hypothetical protein
MAYSSSVSRRQIQTRSHAYQTIPPVKVPPAPSITMTETRTLSDIGLLPSLSVAPYARAATAASVSAATATAVRMR